MKILVTGANGLLGSAVTEDIVLIVMSVCDVS